MAYVGAGKKCAGPTADGIAMTPCLPYAAWMFSVRWSSAAAMSALV